MSAMLDSYGFIDNIRVMAECVYCQAPITDTDRSRRLAGGYCHVECPDARTCEHCDRLCLEAHGTDTTPATCCKCRIRWERYCGTLRDKYECGLCQERKPAAASEAQ